MNEKDKTYADQCFELARKVVSQYSEKELRSILEGNYAVDYFQHPDTFEEHSDAIKRGEVPQ